MLVILHWSGLVHLQQKGVGSRRGDTESNFNTVLKQLVVVNHVGTSSLSTLL